ncbi:MAG: glycine--tRNA ligase subunit beta [Coriobacteriia bacterium]
MPRTLLVEVGTEEIPSAPLYSAVEQLREAVPAALSEASVDFGEVLVSASPRRLAIVVTEVAESQPDVDSEVKGPPVKIAFDDAGGLTPAALGFAKKVGVDPSEFEVRSEGSAEYVYASVHRKGRPTTELLLELVPRLIGGIEWPKSMRWGSGKARFSRPVRWLVGLYGDEVVPFEFAGLRAGRESRGHRFLAPAPVTLNAADEYGKAMAQAKVVVDIGERREIIRHGIDAAAGKGYRAVVPQKVFDEVVNLVEWPTAAAGVFDEEFLAVPREVLETAMESHQRYFPVEDSEGELTNRFVVVHNGPPELTDEIVRGHERVLRARLADASFFFEEDQKVSLEEHVQRLDSIVFQERLGTVAQRVERMEKLAERLADMAQVEPDVRAWAVRAAHLSKADLVTQMVVEFPTLQGVMGRHYALRSGEAPEVALAILEHYLPRHAGDDLPSSQAGRLVSLADKLDTITGIFAAGMPPTGSADPYGLRRAALGVLRILIDSGMPIRLDEAIGAALDGLAQTLPDIEPAEVGETVRGFILGRLETVLKGMGHAYDTVEAVLAVAGDDPADAAARAQALTAFRAQPACADLSTAFERAKNLADPSVGEDVDASLLGPEEGALAQALAEVESGIAEAMDARDYFAVLSRLASLRGPIDAFFDNVLVMDSDESLRRNRLALLNRFVRPFMGFADLSKLAG